MRECIKRMDLKLMENQFLVEDPIIITAFLARFICEANIQEISEAQAIFEIPIFLNGFTKSQSETGVDIVALEDSEV